MPADRMFQVIVVGGIGLVGAACASSVETASGGSGTTGGGGFPSEGPVQVMEAGVDATQDAVEEFPSEGPMMIDSGQADVGFPDETDAIVDAGPPDVGFPSEAPK